MPALSAPPADRLAPPPAGSAAGEKGFLWETSSTTCSAVRVQLNSGVSGSPGYSAANFARARHRFKHKTSQQMNAQRLIPLCKISAHGACARFHRAHIRHPPYSALRPPSPPAGRNQADATAAPAQQQVVTPAWRDNALPEIADRPTGFPFTATENAVCTGNSAHLRLSGSAACQRRASTGPAMCPLLRR